MVDVLFQQTNWKKYAREILTFIELFLLIDLKQYASLTQLAKDKIRRFYKLSN
jgi:hypothetical protein